MYIIKSDSVKFIPKEVEQDENDGEKMMKIRFFVALFGSLFSSSSSSSITMTMKKNDYDNDNDVLTMLIPFYYYLYYMRLLIIQKRF